MTVSLFLLIIDLALLQNLLTHWRGKSVAIRLWIITLGLLVMMFSPVLPLSHFTFEGVPTWMIWPGFIVALYLFGRMVFAAQQDFGNLERSDKIISIVVITGFAVWLLVGILFSAPESGPTPNLWDSGYYVVNWVAIIFLASALMVAFLRLGNGKKVWKAFFAVIYLVAALILIVGAVE